MSKTKIVIYGILLAVLLQLLLAFPLMWAWNIAVVAIWKLPAITWVQAIGLDYLLFVFWFAGGNIDYSKKNKA
jgi:hypothetical protein